MGKTRRSFTKEFKLEAVRLVIEEKRRIAQVARELGMRDTVLGRWIKESEQNQGDAFPGKGNLPAEAEELRRLRRENERLQIEHAILKKAIAIFSKESR